MATVNGVAYGTLNNYNSGFNADNGYNNKLFHLDRLGIEYATNKKVFSQFASTRYMPTHSGREYRVKVYHYSYERMPWAVQTGPMDAATIAFNAEFQKKGYISSRDLSAVGSSIFGDTTSYPLFSGSTDTTNWWNQTNKNVDTLIAEDGGVTAEGKLIDQTTDSDALKGVGKRIFEGQTHGNRVTIKDTTINAFINQFGEMLEYTEDVELFNDDNIVARYRRDMGMRANDIDEDLNQYTMLQTPNKMFSGTATSLETMGTGIGAGTPDATTGENAVEESFKINYKLLQKVVQRLGQYKVPKVTQMVTGSVKIDTKTVPPCYVAIVGDQVKTDILNVTRGKTYEKNFAFDGVEKYASAGTAFDGEFGRIGEVRFIHAPNMLVEAGKGAEVDENYVGSLSRSTNGKFDVFPILFIGEDSFAKIMLQGKNITFASEAPKPRFGDPYGKRGFFSYKFWYGSIILRPERLLRLNVLATA